MKWWRRPVGAVVDRFAVPIAAAIVGWIVTAAWLVPYLSVGVTEAVAVRWAIQAAVALVAFLAAQRWL